MRSKNTRPVHKSKMISEPRENIPHSPYLQLLLRIAPNDDRGDVFLAGSPDISKQNMAGGTRRRSRSMANFIDLANESL